MKGGHIINDIERQLLALPKRLRGLGLKIFCDNATVEYDNSIKVTADLQNQILRDSEKPDDKTRNQVKNERKKLNYDDAKRTYANGQKGVSNWLTSLPMKEHGFDLSSQEFRDAIRIRYGWQLERLPAMCACGSSFGVSHALSCKKGGFVTLRHNEVRDITAELLKEVCQDVRKEPMLGEVVPGELIKKSSNRSREARLDVSAVNF